MKYINPKNGTAGRAASVRAGVDFRVFPSSGTVSALLFLLLSVLFLPSFLACAPDDRVAGGDDFPNSVQTLGKSAVKEGGDTTEWNAYKQAPDSADGLYDTTYVPDSVPEEGGSGLPKRSLDGLLQLGDGIIPGRDVAGAVRALDTLLDSITGVLSTVRVQSTAQFTLRDTTWHRDSAGLVVILRVSGALDRPDGSRETFAFDDGDGDGLLTARAANSVVVIRMAWRLPSGDSGERTLRVTAGADRNFNLRADNALLAFAQTHLSGGDTLLHLVLRDGDGDGLIFNPLRDSSLVDVERVSRSTTGAYARLTMHYRLAAFARPQAARNRAVRFRSVLETGIGTTETVALGRDSLPDFAPGDTGRVRVVFTGERLIDTLARSEWVFRVRLSDTAGHHAGNTLHRVDRDKTFRHGTRSGLWVTRWPAAPVPDGSFARVGTLFLRSDYRDGSWAEFSGEFTPTGSTGTWTDSEGRGGLVHYDASGAIVSPSVNP
jgi:hypothetical protein